MIIKLLQINLEKCSSNQIIKTIGLHQKCQQQFSKIDYKKKDYFKILKVNENATSDEIKKEYYKLVKQYHPDINKGDIEYFKLINEAYEVIGDDKQRKEYILQKDQPSSSFYTNQQSSDQYYKYEYKKSNKYDYYYNHQESYYQSSSNKDYNDDFYNYSYKGQKFNQGNFNSNFSSKNHTQFDQSTLKERMNHVKIKILAFGFCILGFYLILHALVFKVFKLGTQNNIYDPMTGNSFAGNYTANNSKKNFDQNPSFQPKNDSRRKDQIYEYQNNLNNDPKK